LVEYVAKKLAFNRDDLDDLIQVGTIGLLRSIERFEPAKEVDFSTFATPNIIGEIKHYFRDKRGILKVPRKLQEQYSKIKKFIKEAQLNGHSPTVPEIAKALELSIETVVESIEAWQSSSVISLDSPAYSSSSKGDGSSQTLLDSIGGEHREDAMLSRVTLRDAMNKLARRDRKIIFLRFYRGLSQSEIAEKMNLSQMHISRLLTAALKTLKDTIDTH
jgi:RNA polymerase sigma-B factor